MPKIERLPVWYEVIKKYKAHRGSGLSAHALVHLTGIPWIEMRKQIVKRHKEYADMYLYRCGTVMAELITIYPLGGTIYNLSLVDELVAEYDPADGYVGIDKGMPQKTLTLHGGTLVLDALHKVVEDYKDYDKAPTKRTK